MRWALSLIILFSSILCEAQDSSATKGFHLAINTGFDRTKTDFTTTTQSIEVEVGYLAGASFNQISLIAGIAPMIIWNNERYVGTLGYSGALKLDLIGKGDVFKPYVLGRYVTNKVDFIDSLSFTATGNIPLYATLQNERRYNEFAFILGFDIITRFGLAIGPYFGAGVAKYKNKAWNYFTNEEYSTTEDNSLTTFIGIKMSYAVF